MNKNEILVLDTETTGFLGNAEVLQVSILDGEGTVLTTAQCLLHPNRNPHLTRADIEQNLCDWLGVSKVLWLGNGLFDDHTDGHVDDIACFAKPGVVLAQRTPRVLQGAELDLACDQVQARWELNTTRWAKVFVPARDAEAGSKTGKAKVSRIGRGATV